MSDEVARPDDDLSHGCVLVIMTSVQVAERSFA
jgi:hypothetical protein